MNRRGFTAGLVGIAGSFLFPRKSEASEVLGFTDEEMARKIVSHDHNVVLTGCTPYFGCSRHHHYADDTDFEGKRLYEQDCVGEWHTTGDVISSGRRPKYTATACYRVREKKAVGTRVEVHFFKESTSTATACDREWLEEWYEISNPDIKSIRFLLNYEDGSLVFGRIQGRWVEL